MVIKAYIRIYILILFISSISGGAFVTTSFASDIDLEHNPKFTSPAPQSVLTNNVGTETFTWTPSETNVTEWWIYFGKSMNRRDYLDSGSLPPEQLSLTVNNLPIDGRIIYAKLWYRIAGSNKWYSVTETFESFEVIQPLFTAPNASSTLSLSETFSWSSNGINATDYWLYIGEDKASQSLFNSGNLGHSTRVEASGLIQNGISTLYVRLCYKINGLGPWLFIAEVYKGAEASDILNITNPSTLNISASGTQTFNWSSTILSSSANFWIYAGSSQGARDFVDTGNLGATLTTTLTNLPTTDETEVWIRLWYQDQEGSAWNYVDQVYRTLIENIPLGTLALNNIVIDQFGYKPNMDKVAVFRDGEIGLGTDDVDYSPGNELALVDEATNEIIFTGSAQVHMDGIIDPLSGDRTWSFDFSSIQTPGTYYVYDAYNNARSATFDIIEDVYDDVLREAFKTFVYQRSGFTKTANIVGENYADDASHLGPLQDLGARLFNDQRNPSTSRDLSGGWYDAGDFKKYSNWTADYVLGLLHAYHANPDAWSDDWNLPDSGNGVPDILDEVRWGVEHLQRMQEIASETTSANAGSVLSVVDSDDSVTPPSSNEANSFYGPATTSATFTSAAAFAFASSTFANLSDQSFQTLASTLSESAISAYQWAEANPNIRFNNAEHGVGNGNSEVSSDYMLDAKHRIAAVYLYGLTGEARYKNYVESNYLNTNLMTIFWATPYEVEEPTALLHYTTLDGINPAIGSAIQTRFNNLMENAGNGRSAIGDDPYRAYVQEYAWGSNKAKSRKGHMYTQLNSYDLGDRSAQDNLNAAAGYLHYIHGVNPLGKVYLTNMSAFGAERSVDEIYHRWFANDTQWDNVNTSFGPPPGYLVGGPNQFYNGSLDINQPPMKSYVETNAYLNGEASWQLTENSNGYQIEYLKLLSQFVD